MNSKMLLGRVMCGLLGAGVNTTAFSNSVSAESQSQTYGYDALGRLVSVVRSNGTSSTYALSLIHI